MSLGENTDASPWVEAGNGSRLYALLASGHPVEARLDGRETMLRLGRYGAVMEGDGQGMWVQSLDFDADRWEFKEVGS